MAGGNKPGPLRDWGGEPAWGGSLLPPDRPSLRPDFGDPGGFEPETSAPSGIRLPWNQPGQPFFADAGELLDSLMARLDRLADLDELTKLVARILGPQSFALGVIYGAGEAFVLSIVDLLGLFKTFVLADLHDATRRNPAWTMSATGGVARYLTAHMLEKYIGEAMMKAADERDALVSELKTIFESPGDFIGKVGDEYAQKFRQFLALSVDPALASQFQAGRVFGELMLDALALIGGGAAVAKGLSRVPRLARLGRTLKGKFSRRIGAAGGEAQAAGGPGLPPARGSSSASARAMKEPKPVVEEAAPVEAADTPKVKLKPAEKLILEELRAAGKTAEPIPRATNRTADFLVDGVPTELKTLTSAGPTTLKNAVQNAAKQGEQILIDARNVNMSPEEALHQIQRAQGSVGNLQGRVTVLTTNGTVTF